MSKIFTSIPYNYADEGNFGQAEIVFISGLLSSEQIAVITARLESEEFFIPTQVGMVALQNRHPDFPTEQDHVWHKFDTAQFQAVDVLPEGVSVLCTAAEFVERFTDIEWDVSKEYYRLGLDDTDDD